LTIKVNGDNSEKGIEAHQRQWMVLLPQQFSKETLFSCNIGKYLLELT
jgi:hypothetical protein